MPFLDTRVRVQHPCPYCDLSVACPDVELALWTSTQSDVFHVAAPSRADLQRVLRAMLETIGARRITQEGTSALVVTHQARWTYPPSVTKIADRLGLWVVPPTIYFGCWETHRVVSPSIAALRRFVADVKETGQLDVLSLRPPHHLDRLHSPTPTRASTFDHAVVLVHGSPSYTSRVGPARLKSLYLRRHQIQSPRPW